MTDEEFYGQALAALKTAEQYLLGMIAEYPGRQTSIRPVISCQSRIKSAESMLKKLENRGFKTDRRSALTDVFDAVGIRIICGFVDDVYKVAKWLEGKKELEIIQSKDYIAWPKPNGYRSYHLCLRICEGNASGALAEIQIRTMAIDFSDIKTFQRIQAKSRNCTGIVRKSQSHYP